MPYDPTRPGLTEAILTAFQSILQSHLADLSTSLGRYSWATSPAATAIIPVQSSQVRIGEPDRVWKWDTSTLPVTGYPLQIYVSNGGQKDGVVATDNWLYIGEGAKIYDLRTHISLLLHPDWPGMVDPFAQQTQREAALAVLSDWVRAVFNDQQKYGHASITLTSSEFHDPISEPGATDYIVGRVTNIAKGLFHRGFAGTEALYGISAMHEAKIG